MTDQINPMILCEAFGLNTQNRNMSVESLATQEQQQVSCVLKASKKCDEVTTEAILAQLGIDENIVKKVIDIKHGFKKIKRILREYSRHNLSSDQARQGITDAFNDHVA
jgi:Zn-finger domain-containing protein